MRRLLDRNHSAADVDMDGQDAGEGAISAIRTCFGLGCACGQAAQVARPRGLGGSVSRGLRHLAIDGRRFAAGTIVGHAFIATANRRRRCLPQRQLGGGARRLRRWA
jgi:hypothetical protein